MRDVTDESGTVAELVQRGLGRRFTAPTAGWFDAEVLMPAEATTAD
jgi:hypothetical protein